MLFLSKPAAPVIRSLLAKRGALPFSYAQVGAARAAPPGGWHINHMRARIGTGRPAHERAVAALFSWRLLAVDGLQVFPSGASLQPDTSVALVSRHFGIWSVDFCRVIYLLKDELGENGVLRTGFAYGTLPGHAMRGEELFSIEWHPAGEQVWYDIFSFSLPAHALTRLITPVARAEQRRFARASLEQAAKIATEPRI